jgi:KaiC/GvpD/RAD55 family RecA-like ATPase
MFCSNGCEHDELTKAVASATGQPAQTPEVEADTAAIRERKRERALALWRGSEPAAGTLADRYLTARGLPGLAASPSLRYRGDTPHPEGGRLPALMALVQDAAGQPLAIHRTYLARNGERASVEPPKASLGPTWGGVIRLDPLTEGQPVVIGEGIESAASAGRLMGFPAWAAISAQATWPRVLCCPLRPAAWWLRPTPIGQASKLPAPLLCGGRPRAGLFRSRARPATVTSTTWSVGQCMADGAGFTVEDAGFRPITAAELLAMEIPPRRTLLTPWLPEKGAAMLYAPRGLGKTFLSLSIAYAVASGGTVLRWQAPEPRRVLFVDGEMPLIALQERLCGVVAGVEYSPPADNFLRFLPADAFRDGLPDLASVEGGEMLEAYAVDTDLLVLDNLSSLAKSGRENEADDWRPMQELVLSLRRRGTSMLLVHHSGKGGQQRGTSRREDVLDTVVALRRPDDYEAMQGARFEVHFEKSRGFTGSDATPFEAALRISDKGALTWDTSDLKQDDKGAAFEMFAGGSKPGEIVKAFGVDRATAYRWQKQWRDGRDG